MKPAKPHATGAPVASAVTATSVVLVSLLLAHAAVGQNRASVVVDLTECVDIVVDHERFACYERRVAESTQRQPQRETPALLDPPEPQSLEERRSARQRRDGNRHGCPDDPPEHGTNPHERRARADSPLCTE